MRRLLALLGCLGAALTAGCANGSDGDTPAPLTVLAASSLTGVLEHLQGAEGVRFSFAGSPSLVAQVRSGAPADVVITASPASLEPLRTAGLVGEPEVIVTNSVVLVVPRANPGRLRGVADLARGALRIALCDGSVPCGAAAQATLTAAGVTASPDTLAPDVKTVLRLVSSGEADAGIVYASDARSAAASVSEVALPAGVAASTSYPAAVVTATRHQDQARRYVASLLEPDAQRALAAAGFGPP